MMHHMLGSSHHPFPFSFTLSVTFSPFSFFLFSHLSFALFFFTLFLLSSFPFLFLPLFLFPLFPLPLFSQFLLPLHRFSCFPGTFFFPHPTPFLVHLHLFMDALSSHAHTGYHPCVQIGSVRERRVQGMCSGGRCCCRGRMMIGCSEHLETGIQIDGRIVIRQGRRVEQVAWWHAGNRPETCVGVHRE